jgi:hypothetical protein
MPLELRLINLEIRHIKIITYNYENKKIHNFFDDNIVVVKI